MSLLQRREIEAQIAAPLVKAFMDEFGRERTLKTVKRVIKRLAKQKGAELAKLAGGNGLKQFVKAVLPLWCEGGALNVEVIEANDQRCSFNVTRCKYAEMYRRLGLADFGLLFSCSRDFAFISGFNRRLKLKRTQTIMEGDRVCDFRIVRGKQKLS
ncbi:MAG: L-2-amino-thiazoline-4-carboxylic acid hydrolase [Verrucomicrobia bacterium]|nr:L-2-amino-thiazoline-4-carboxylic acid hydrolase [Verrucomicrobiota bacterium]